MGSPLRKFLHPDGCAAAILHLLNQEESSDLVNLSGGVGITNKELTHLIAKIVGDKSEITHYLTSPDRTPRKLMGTTLNRFFA